MMEAVEEIKEPARIINITKHFAERWAQRILEIGKDIADKKARDQHIKEYAAYNFEQIKEHANRTYQYADYLWAGQLYDNITRKYYIEDNIIFVVNTTSDAMITTYKVDFGFPGEGNTQVRKTLIDEIQKLTQQKEDIDFEILVEMEKKQNELENTSENVRILEEQLKNMKEKKLFIETEVKNMNWTSNHLDLEIKKYTNMLVNSREYREDIKTMP